MPTLCLSPSHSRPQFTAATMVLVFNGVLQDDCPIDTSTLFMQHPVYRDYANQLLSIPTKTVGPVGLLYVGQREMAAVGTHDKNVSVIGSDDVTTCIIVVVRHSGSGAVALAHLDGNGMDEAVSTMVSRVQNLAIGYPEGRLELQLIGGYSDTRNYSEELFASIMREWTAGFGGGGGGLWFNYAQQYRQQTR